MGGWLAMIKCETLLILNDSESHFNEIELLASMTQITLMKSGKSGTLKSVTPVKIVYSYQKKSKRLWKCTVKDTAAINTQVGETWQKFL